MRGFLLFGIAYERFHAIVHRLFAVGCDPEHGGIVAIGDFFTLLDRHEEECRGKKISVRGIGMHDCDRGG